MTDTQALRDLLVKVEAGEAGWNRLATIAEDALPPREAALAATAYSGSLDAAKALHDAVLPMWDCYLKISADKNPHRAELRPLTPMSGNPSIIIQWGGMPRPRMVDCHPPRPDRAGRAMTACRWITDAEVPTGRYLVPGCWNRVVHGDDAECQCSDRPETMQEQIDRLQAEIEQLKLQSRQPRATDTQG